MPDPAIQATIARIAQEEGIDPAYALAVAERESNFNPNAGGKGTIKGLFQTTQQTRRGYAIPDNAGLEDQVRGFARYTKGLRGEMQSVLGRDPSWDETYVGHYWGGPRAARVIGGAHADMAPSDLFSARELADNKELAQGKSAGALAKNITRDIAKRRGRFGSSASPADEAGFASFGQPEQGATPPAAPAPDKPTRDAGTPPRSRFDFAQFGEPQQAVDFSTFGQPPQQQAMSNNPTASAGEKVDTRPGREIDLSRYGQPMAPMPQSVTAFAPQGGM